MAWSQAAIVLRRRARSINPPKHSAPRPNDANCDNFDEVLHFL